MLDEHHKNALRVAVRHGGESFRPEALAVVAHVPMRTVLDLLDLGLLARPQTRRKLYLGTNPYVVGGYDGHDHGVGYFRWVPEDASECRLTDLGRHAAEGLAREPYACVWCSNTCPAHARYCPRCGQAAVDRERMEHRDEKTRR